MAASGRIQRGDDLVQTWEQASANDRPPLLVLRPLAEFLDAEGLGEGEIAAQPIGEGHSNVTYLLQRGQRELVLRRPPRPPLPPSAHDVIREATLLCALRGTGVRVPEVLAVCESDSVIGSPFYVMEKIEGEVIVSSVPGSLDDAAQRRQISLELIDALAEIHSVDWRSIGLQSFGKPEGYLERQLRRFSGLWELNRTRELEPVISVRDWLQAHLPRQEEATIVHGDFRLGNTIFAAESPPRLLAVLDWEMATIGDPLADVGYLCMMWTEAGDPDVGLREQVAKVTRADGFLSRAQLVQRYEQVTGRSMRHLRWYTTLALWKMAIFMEGNYKRALAGTTDDPYLRSFGDGVVELAQTAKQTAFGEGGVALDG